MRRALLASLPLLFAAPVLAQERPLPPSEERAGPRESRNSIRNSVRRLRRELGIERAMVEAQLRGMLGRRNLLLKQADHHKQRIEEQREKQRPLSFLLQSATRALFVRKAYNAMQAQYHKYMEEERKRREEEERRRKEEEVRQKRGWWWWWWWWWWCSEWQR